MQNRRLIVERLESRVLLVGRATCCADQNRPACDL
jgi:hypothetical protein